MSRGNVEVVRRAYAAADAATESGDLASFIREFYDPNAQYKPIEEGESLRGHDEIAEYFRRWLDVWDDFRLEVEELIDAGNQVLSSVLLSGRADASGVEISQRVFYVTELRNRKIVRVREFLDRGEAVEAAGLSEQPLAQWNVDVVRRSLEAGERRDYGAAFADARPDLEWVVAKEHPNSRTLHGHEEIVSYLDEWEEMLEDIRFEPAEYRQADDLVVAIGKIRGTGKGGGVEVEVPLALLYRFETGKIARVEEYLDPDEALGAVGLGG